MNEEMREVETKQEKKLFIRGALIGALSMFACCAVVVVALFLCIYKEFDIVNMETFAKLELIQEYIDSEYLYEYDEEALQDGIILGYLEAFDDPYTTYYDEEETLAILESTTGSFSGIGAVISQSYETGVLTIVSVNDGSPAEEAGILAGDIIQEVDGEDVTGRDISSVVADIKGDEGTTVDIGVLRGSDYEELTITVTRGIVEYVTVSYEMLEDQTGYIYVSSFDTVTSEQFEIALNALEEQGMESLIVDLRSNTGGNLSTVCEMLEMILPEGLVVYTEDKNGDGEAYYSSGENEFTKPLVVLVNEYTASASEIFAIAVQDYGIGEIVGTVTYGKGVVQQLISLPDSTMIKITTSEYFSPLGNNIHGVGVIPDVEIEFDYEDLETDEQLEMAIQVITELE